MKRMIAFASNRPWLVLLLLTIVTVIATTQLDKLRINISAEGMMVKDDPARTFYEENQQIFGSDSPTIILLRDPNLFDQNNLKAIQDTVKRIEKLPFVSHTLSLFSIKNIKSVDGEIRTQGFFDQLPESREQAKAIQDEALINPLIADNLLSTDGTSMAINVYLDKVDSNPDFDRLAVQGIDDALHPLVDKLEQAFQIGSPYVRQSITHKIREDQKRILPVSLIALILTLAFALRYVQGSLIPLLTAGVSIVWTLAFMAVLDIPINVMTSIVPALLIIIGSTEDVHMISEYLVSRRFGMPRKQALESMGKKMGTAILLTFITTYLGFLSITTNNIGLLQQFGFVASTGLLINFLVTTLMVPALLRLLDHRKTFPPAKDEGISASLVSYLFWKVRKHQKISIAALAAITITAVYGATLIRVNNNPMGYFNDEETLKIRATTLENSLSGMQTFSVVVSSGIDGTFHQVKYLEELEALQKHIESTGLFDKSFSFADYLGLVNIIMEEDMESGIYLPESDDLVREYLYFIKFKDIKDYVTEDFNRARIIVRHHIHSSYELDDALQEIQKYIDTEMDPGLNATITGESVLTNKAADYMASGQARSLLLMIIVIWAIISLLFVNSKAGLTAIIPNLFPIVVLFGVMGFLNISLDTGTAMVAAIALGICVDDTTHFMVRYHHNSRRIEDTDEALDMTVREEATPIVATSVALALGFGVLAFSGFPPVVYFGLLSAMVMILALMATFIITPLLLSNTPLVTMWDILALQLKKDVIEDSPLFHGMRPSEIKKLILISEVRQYEDGENIVTQGEEGDEMFVVLEGDADVWLKHEDGSRHNLVTLSAGAVFGEVALVSKQPRATNVSASGPTEMLVLNWTAIQRIARTFPRTSSKFFLNISSNLGKLLAKTTSQSKAMRDDATGVYTREFFKGLLRMEMERSDRYKDHFSLVTIDCCVIGEKPDHLEQSVYDNIFTHLTRDLSGSVRKVDINARMSKERLVLLLTKTTPSHADHIADRLREKLKQPDYQVEGLETEVNVAIYSPGDDKDDFFDQHCLEPESLKEVTDS
ncbi:MAG: cyclic nucleotide-binding domain-containing protein [Gammaproteobacteria bacterium]|nr:MAG: cyclic nucleotide-binding domain-containing protein [Gammaproteobacteria bacterium]